MEKMVWQDDYATGFHSIDFQHKILVGIINDLIEASNSEKDNGLWLEVVLDELRSYTKFHFSNEALLMGKYEYEEIQDHSNQHAEFVSKLNQFCKDYQAKKTGMSEDLLTYLKEWLINHILVEDKKLGAFLVSRENKNDIRDFPFP